MGGLEHPLAGFTINMGRTGRNLYIACRSTGCYWTHRLLRLENDLEVALEQFLEHRDSGFCTRHVRDKKELPDILSRIIVTEAP